MGLGRSCEWVVVQFEIPKELSFRSRGIIARGIWCFLLAESRFLAGNAGFAMTPGEGSCAIALFPANVELSRQRSTSPDEGLGNRSTKCASSTVSSFQQTANRGQCAGSQDT